MFYAKCEHQTDNLDPILSQETIEYHYGKHHVGYANTLNQLVSGTEYADMSLEEIIIHSRDIDPKIFNNASQLYNHDFYWKILTKDGHQPSGRLLEIIEQQFDTFDRFITRYIEHANTMFGSGWSWIVLKDKQLEFLNTNNAENPIGLPSVRPICVIDLWEHAYYIDYRNRRAEYIDCIIKNGINWSVCEKQIAEE